VIGFVLKDTRTSKVSKKRILAAIEEDSLIQQTFDLESSHLVQYGCGCDCLHYLPLNKCNVLLLLIPKAYTKRLKRRKRLKRLKGQKGRKGRMVKGIQTAALRLPLQISSHLAGSKSCARNIRRIQNLRIMKRAEEVKEAEWAEWRKGRKEKRIQTAALRRCARNIRRIQNHRIL